MTKLEHLISKPTCFKDLLPSTIDLILTKRKQNFMKLNVYQMGISDHLKMIILVLRKKLSYRQIKNCFLSLL